MEYLPRPVIYTNSIKRTVKASVIIVVHTPKLYDIVDFQPQMTSTRLKSEEIYRERVLSDSLFTARSRNQANVNLNSNLTGNQPQEEQEDVSSVQQDDVFENDHLFGPPPLPKADSKSAKSKELLLFDDSDSGDELFSTTSSGSRSQKSSDFLTTVPQHPDKVKITQRGGLFDEEIDIFGRKDSPDVDIFGIVSKPMSKEESNLSTRKPPGISDSDGLFGSNIRDAAPNHNNVEKRQNVPPKEIRLFDDVEDIDDGDLFATKPIKTEAKSESRIFNDDDEGNLFSAKETFDAKPALGNAKQPVGTSESGTDTADRDASTRKTKRKGSDILSGNGLFSSTVVSHGLVFEDDDYDDLFSDKSLTTGKRKGDEKSVPEIKVDTKVEGLSAKGTEAPVAPDIIVEDQGSSVSTSSKVDQRSEKDTRRVTSQGTDTVGNTESEPKKIPPKSLDIHVAVSSSPPEESGQAARRTVSGKIKNLMGRMGDLKILSPMDTPPLWRRSEEKTDEEDSNADRDSDDGGCISTQGYSSPPSASEDSTTQKQSLQSTVSGESNVESAISFDEPAQVETLSIAASKTRVRIQAKRRPQSRHARKSALRQSGIDFDTVDAAGNHSQDEGHRGNQLSNTLGKEPTSSTNPNTLHIVAATSDRLVPSLANDNLHRIGDANISLAVDDKSELGSISKESSMSANKNTLLSPSTDEEDLFDVPPDLPEDPQKEDTLFGRAPILSPVERVLEKPPASSKSLKDTHIRKPDSAEAAAETGTSIDKIGNDTNLQTETNIDSNTKAAASAASEEDNKRDSAESMDESKEMIDPLRDSSHDPLKDPSSLFAFVTKTPSPEKGKNLLFAEDDSLFSSGMRKSSEEQTMTKPGLNLFADDTEGDLFSVPLAKPVKKPLKDAKTILFDDDDQDDEDDSLFGSITKKSMVKSEPEKKNAAQQPRKKISLLDDGANLFLEQPEQSQQSDSGSIREQLNKSDAFASVTEAVKTSHITDILADQSSSEDDIFAVKSIPKKVVTTKSLFPPDDDDDDSGNIFGKKFSTNEPQMKSTETRASVKKSITRDLKKTAEKIGEDPLSILQND